MRKITLEQSLEITGYNCSEASSVASVFISALRMKKMIVEKQVE